MKFSAPLSRRLIAAAAVIAAVAASAAIVFQDALFRWSIRPAGDYARSAPPPRPDYADQASWAVRPERPPPGGWESPWGVDVFFVHPGSARSGSGWNAAIDDARSVAILRQHLLPNHLTPFAGAGPVYAPLYRQAALYAMISPEEDSGDAFDIAYQDVLRAFDHYMENDNRGRGVMLVGIEQGGVHAMRLLMDRFQTDGLGERLAAAYIIDAPALPDALGLIQPACAEPNAIHCIASWKTVIRGERGERESYLENAPYWDDSGEIQRLNGKQPLCVNPLSWRTGDGLAPRLDHRGGARVTASNAGDPRIIPEAVSTRCAGGVLKVERPSQPELQRASGWGGQYMAPRLNIFFADIASNAAGRALQASVWMEANARRPAKPLPPAVQLPDAPIHRQDGVISPVE